ncbi:hypothetical protein H4R34_006296, partial [Dimargaris verticillata]
MTMIARALLNGSNLYWVYDALAANEFDDTNNKLANGINVPTENPTNTKRTMLY